MRAINQLGGHQRLVEAKHGVFVYNHHDFYIGKALELYGEYAERELDLFRSMLSPTDHVIEVGANIGTHTVPLGEHLSEGMVHAFEPQPVVFQNLCANLSVNCLENVLAWPFAVGAEFGSLVVPPVDYGRQGNFGGISLVEDGDGFRVQVIALDTYAASLDVALIKVDVEGMERQVLEGAEETIGRCRPFLYLENDRLEKSQGLIEKCWEFGYRLYWHAPMLFNPDNWCGNRENVYGNVAAFNMIGIPKEREFLSDGATEVLDSSAHPLKKA